MPERDIPQVRELLVEPYRLLYQVTESDVVILGLLHQRRDFERWGGADGLLGEGRASGLLITRDVVNASRYHAA